MIRVWVILTASLVAACGNDGLQQTVDAGTVQDFSTSVDASPPIDAWPPLDASFPVDGADLSSSDVSTDLSLDFSTGADGPNPGTPQLAVTPTDLDFGTILLGETSVEQVVTVSNPTAFRATGLMLTVPDGFVLSRDDCSQRALAPMESCDFGVSFQPALEGVYADTLSVAPANGQPASVSLRGEALATAWQIRPASHSFGSIDWFTSSSPTTFTVTNVSQKESGLPMVSFGGQDPDQFELDSNGCVGPIAAGGSCDVDVSFAPTRCGDVVASLEVAAMPGGTASARLAGTGQSVGDLSTSRSFIDFGAVPVGTTSMAQTITLTWPNCNLTGVITTTVPSGFQLRNDGCTGQRLGPAPTNVSCQVDVVFQPSAAGIESGGLVFSMTPGGSRTISLTGEGI